MYLYETLSMSYLSILIFFQCDRQCSSHLCEGEQNIYYKYPMLHCKSVFHFNFPWKSRLYTFGEQFFYFPAYYCLQNRSLRGALLEMPLQYCKVISLQLIKINEKKKRNATRRRYGTTTTFTRR